MQKPVRAPYTTRQLLVCTNQRDPSTGKPSCGMNGSLGLRERLKGEVKARGLKDKVMVTGTTCLGYCPAQGCAVGFVPDGDWAIVDITEEDEAALLERLTRGV